MLLGLLTVDYKNKPIRSRSHQLGGLVEGSKREVIV